MSVRRQPMQMPAFVRKTPHAKLQPNSQPDPYRPLLAIYILRLAMGLQSRLPYPALTELFCNSLGEMTGLVDIELPGINVPDSSAEPLLHDESTNKPNQGELLKLIQVRLKRLISNGMQVDLPLFNNLTLLSDSFGLNETEQEILVLRLLIDHNIDFSLFVGEHCYLMGQTALEEYLQIMTTRSREAIHDSLKPDSLLAQLGWIHPVPNFCSLEEQLQIPVNLAFELMKSYDSTEALVQSLSIRLKPTTLSLADFQSIKKDLDVVTPFLQAALETRQRGINLLIHGVSTTGRRELAKLLGKVVDGCLFEIPLSAENRIQMTDRDRFSASKLMQNWLVQQGQIGLILIDTADGLLPQRAKVSLFEEEPNATMATIDPATLKHELQHNALPVIWIVDKIKEIEPHFLSNFDYVLEVDRTPVALRRQHIDSSTQTLAISTGWRECLAKQDDIPLKQIDKAAAIVQLSQSKTNLNAEEIMERIINANTQLQRRSGVLQAKAFTANYDLSFTNTSIKLDDLVVGLQKNPRGNFCFFGPPGTGKTAFAHHLADKLGLPLSIKRASDILSKYIGQSERNIARMFEKARRQETMLLLDEADSLIADRRDARYQWEISQVNELLTQMERFNGIFICTTNQMDKLDTASLRRFDFKIKFDYLTADQRWSLFEQQSQWLGADWPDDTQEVQHLKQQVQRLTKLTPGDFAVLNRQSTLLGKSVGVEQMVATLEQECLAKGESFSQIGFVH